MTIFIIIIAWIFCGYLSDLFLVNQFNRHFGEKPFTAMRVACYIAPPASALATLITFIINDTY